MKCQWDALLSVLPDSLRDDLGMQSKEILLEIRLRRGQRIELIYPTGSRFLTKTATAEDIRQCIHYASRYSPWTAATQSSGYITVQGGHRIGICGRYTEGSNGAVIKDPTMLCIRIARDIAGISKGLADLKGSILILGRPGCGKTTLLRDLIRNYSGRTSSQISVVDEREELFPKWNGEFCFPTGPKTDVLSGCSKNKGIIMLLRNMTPSVIAVDEITAEEDCTSLLEAGWCGVELYATAHARNLKDLYSRKIYLPLVQSGIFENIVVLNEDKSWRLERRSI